MQASREEEGQELVVVGKTGETESSKQAVCPRHARVQTRTPRRRREVVMLRAVQHRLLCMRKLRLPRPLQRTPALILLREREVDLDMDTHTANTSTHPPYPPQRAPALR